MRRCVLVYVFLLSVVNARDRFDRFDDALSVAQRRRIGVAFGEAFAQPRQEMREVRQLSVDATHRREAIAARERAAETWIDFAFIHPLVFDEVFCDYGVRFADERGAL